MVRSVIFLVCLVLLTSCESTTDNTRPFERSGISKEKITIGSSSALSGHASFLGTQYLHGALAYINEVNSLGGVNNRQIEVIALDDQYNPTKTIANTQQLIHDEKVFALMNYVGTPTSMAVRPIIESAKIPAFGFFTGAEGLRRPFSKNFFHLRDSYYAEAEGAVSYFVDKLGLKRIGVFYQEDAFGLAVLTGIQLALQNRQLEPVVTDTYIRGSMDIQESVQRINAADVDVIMMVGTYSPLAKFIKMSHKLNKHPLFSTVSFVGSEAFARELVEVQQIEKKYYKDVIVTQVVPSPFQEKMKVIWEYIALSIKYFPDDKPNYVALEGFLNAKIFILALQNAGEDLTRSKFINELEKIQDYDLGIEKKISYDNQDHEGINGIYYSKLAKNKQFMLFDVPE